MGDPSGIISGFAMEAVNLSIKQILHHINIALRCRKELESLASMISTLQGINSDLQKYRAAVSSGRSNPSANFPSPSSVNKWLNELNMLLLQANDMVQQCTIPKFDCISRYTMSRNITRMIARIEKHESKASLIHLVHSFSQVQQLRGEMAASSSSAPVMKGSMYIEDQLVVGQDKAFDRLEQLVMHNTERIGVVGMGGSGKTLLLKRLFNNLQILFPHDLLLWVTVSSTPSFPALRNQLCKKLNNERLDRENQEEVKNWIRGKLIEKKFILFLDDVWEASATGLLDELGVPVLMLSAEAQLSNIIIVSCRSLRALRQMGIPTPSPAIVDMQNLMEDDSWKLFSYHAFPYHNGSLPESINEEVARNVCKECGNLPLAIKVIGRAMSAVTLLHEWQSTLVRLQNAQPISSAGDVEQYLYDRLRLSYDSLADFDVSLQLCFLYLAAFPEDEVISTRWIRNYWIGEGLLKGDDAHGTVQTYVNLLADRCLIEPDLKDIDGLVICFRVHDVLHDLARHIGATEENCLFDAARGLKYFPQVGAHSRISLFGNELSSVPNSLQGAHIRCLIMNNNVHLKTIPTKVIANMTSLTILDLSRTSLQSLPESVGRLNHLVCLRLRGVPIKRLPDSLTSLNKLQILDLRKSRITQLPSKIHRLRSLRILDISYCEKLKRAPHGISKLTSLEESGFWMLPDAICSSRALIDIVRGLKHLKRLQLRIKDETIQEGTLGITMEELYLGVTGMESLPQDIFAMSKLRVLFLKSPGLRRVEHSFCRFQQLTTLSLCWCRELKELPDLHKLVSLKRLDIVDCTQIEQLPKEFGERGAFPKLEVLMFMWLEKLGELPEVDEAAMPSLKTLTICNCGSLKTMGKGYWNLKSVREIGIHRCEMLRQKLEEEGNVTERNTAVQTIMTSSIEIAREFFDSIYWQLDSWSFLPIPASQT